MNYLIETCPILLELEGTKYKEQAPAGIQLQWLTGRMRNNLAFLLMLYYA
ncbi:hypothetical protein PAE9249_04731 [Paenibacillus sp. CECT 9249]|nr:hypothetical protein PAE9249_04731 [Paenibacillus sp. CECT 9249]